MSFYQKFIVQDLVALGHAEDAYDPRHIEGYMRLQYGTLDHLDPETFREEVAICAGCIDADGRDNAERLAHSYGL